MKTQKEIFNQIRHSITSIISKNTPFKYAILDIKRLIANIGYTGYYVTTNNEKKWLDIFSFELDEGYIEDLYNITQTQPPIHKNWNRAKYTLYPKGQMQIEYIWDKELQEEVDSYSQIKSA